MIIETKDGKQYGVYLDDDRDEIVYISAYEGMHVKKINCKSIVKKVVRILNSI